MYTLRYLPNAPLQPRPHGPTVAKFSTYTEAENHRADQPNGDVLEVVQR